MSTDLEKYKRKCKEEGDAVVKHFIRDSVFKFQANLIERLIDKDVCENDKFFAALRIMTGDSAELYKKAMKQAFANFYILDSDFSYLKRLVSKYTDTMHPLRIFTDNYSDNLVGLDYAAPMIEYYQILMESIRVKFLGTNLIEFSETYKGRMYKNRFAFQAGADAACIALAVQCGVGVFGKALHERQLDYQPLVEVHGHAVVILKESSIDSGSKLEQAIVKLLDFMSKLFSTKKSLNTAFNNLVEMESHQKMGGVICILKDHHQIH